METPETPDHDLIGTMQCDCGEIFELRHGDDRVTFGYRLDDHVLQMHHLRDDVR
jgi:hypothetical protein